MFLGLAVPSNAQQIINGSRTLLGNWDASGAATTKPVKAGTAIPASCGTGEIFFKTDANPGANLYLCTTGNTWTQAQGGVSNFSQISGTATAGQLPASIQYFSSGTGAPGGVCTAGQNAYLDTTNLDYWFCDATNAWKKVLSTTSTGPFALTGQTGTAPATPAAGFATVYLSNTDKTLHTVSDAGTDTRYAGLSESNTWGAYLQDFGGSTVRLPIAAGFTTATNGGIGYDSTANRLHTSINSTDSIVPNAGTTAPTSGDCAKWGTNYQLQDSGASCGGSVTSVDGSGANGVETVAGGSVAAITGNGTVRASSPINTQSATSYSFVTGDRGKVVAFTNAAAVAVTLPQATSGASTNFPSGWCTFAENQGGQIVTITPNTSTILVSGAAATSLHLAVNQGAQICSDATNYTAIPYNYVPPSDAIGGASYAPLGFAPYDQIGTAIAANTVKVWQIVVPFPMLVSSIAWLNGTNTAGQYGAMGIYTDVAGTCTTLIAQTTPLQVNVVADTNMTGTLTSAVFLQAGKPYWLAWTADASTVTYKMWGTAAAVNIFNQASHARAGGFSGGTGSGASLAFPASCGTVVFGSAINPPMVLLQP